MSALWAALALVCGALPDEVPTDRPVADLTSTLSEPDRSALEAEMQALRDEHQVQMAIVLVHTLDGMTIEDWGIKLFQRWQLGTAGNDDGVLAVLSLDDRLSRLEVGYGLEGWIPDPEAQRMLDGMRDDLRAGDFAGALRGLIGEVRTAVEEYAPGKAPPGPPLGARGAMTLLVVCFGIGGGIGFALGRRRFDVLERQAERASKPGGKPGDGDARDPGDATASRERLRRLKRMRKLLPYLVFIGLPLVLALVFRRGSGFWWAMPTTYLIWSIVGMTIVTTARSTVVGVVLYAAGIAALCMAWLGGSLAGELQSGGAVLETAGAMCALVLFVWGFCGLVAIMPSGSGGSGTVITGGGSSSSYGSRSSSTSSSSSSSSSSSGGWSGGGGRSGGGGATSSW